jgi:lactose/L-arabinose transport system substrate-binding protein
MRRTLTAVLAGVTATLLAVSGCAAGGTSSGKDPKLKANASPALKGNVTVWSWDVAAQAMKRLAPAFEQQHPGVKVNVVDIGYDNAYDKITVGMKAGKGLPDVLTIEDAHVPSYTGNFPGGLYDLSALAGQYKQSYDQAAWKTDTDASGKVFALPWDTGPCALFYRTDYFKQAGIDPNSIKTWDDYVRAGEQIKARTGKKLLVVDSEQDSNFPMMLQQQGQLYFAGGKVAVNSPQAIRAGQLMKTLNDKGLIDYEKGWDGLVSATKAGKVATTPYAVWWSGTLTDEMKELSGKFGVVPLPAFTAGGVRTSNDGGSSLAISSQTKNPQAAWAFIQYMLTNTANQVSMAKNEGLFPAYLPALSDPYFSAPQPYYGGQTVFKTFADLAKDIPPVDYTKDEAKADDIVNSTISGILLHGRNPKSALDSAAQQIASATGLQIAK